MGVPDDEGDATTALRSEEDDFETFGRDVDVEDPCWGFELSLVLCFLLVLQDWS